MANKRRILVIDDSEIVLGAVEDTLSDAGYQVVGVTEPTPDHVQGAARPDLILMDINMPQVFGDDATQLIKQQWGFDGPIYLFSSLSEQELELRRQQSGADGYICKDWGMEKLVETIRTALD